MNAIISGLVLGGARLPPVEAEQVLHQIDIERSTLNAALAQLAQQTNIQVARFSDDDTARISVGPLKGSYTLLQSLDQLLAGSGMTYRFVNERTVSIVKLPNSTAVQSVASATANNDHRGWLARIAAFLAACGTLSSTAVCAQDGAETLEEVVVTGSRVITNGNDSPTPVTVVSVEQLQQMNPGPISQALAQLPQLMSTPNTGGQGQGAAANLNLRGVNGGRGLILFDGHRMNPTANSNAVDTNVIPSMLLKRVDIVTGGASAVYGSEAITGVVNYVVDNNFNGLKVTGQAGVSTYNDDHTYNIGIAAGTPLFGGRGHVEFSYQHNDDPGVRSRLERDWGRKVWSMQGAVPGSSASPGSAANPWQLYSNVRINVTTYGGLINSATCAANNSACSALAGLQFAQNGVLSPFNHGTATGSSSAEIGGDGVFYNVGPAFAVQNIDQAFGRFDFNFTDDVKAYAELAFTTIYNEAAGTGQNIELRSRTIGYNNAFLSTIQPQYKALLPASLQSGANAIGTYGAQGSFTFSRMFSQFDAIPAPKSIGRTNNYVFLTGLDGSLGDYKWNVGYERAYSVNNSWGPSGYSNPRLFAALNAVVSPTTGQIVCAASLVNANYANCVPLNVFGPTSSSKAAWDYIGHPSFNANRNIMDDVTAAITGAPVNNWAGPINMALSAEWRKLSYQVTSDTLPSDPVDCTGIQFNCVVGGTNPTTPWAGSSALFPKTSTSVKELAYEAQVPLLKDLPLAQSLELNAAARYTHYDTSGTVWAWKAGLTYAMTDDLSFRATRSRDIRAPSLQNLFAPQTVALANLTDAHTNSQGQVNVYSQGNPTLKPELADTWTFGYVFQPQFIEGFSLSMDGYYIKINDALVGSNTQQPSSQQVCEASGGTSPICALIIRPFDFSNRTPNGQPGSNFPTAIYNVTLNVGALTTYGIDTEIAYANRIAGHNYRLRALVNFQPHLVYDNGPSGVLDQAGAADGQGGLAATPNVKGLLQVNYELFKDFSVIVQERYRNAVRQNASNLVYFAIGKQPPTWYTDLTLNYKTMAAGGDLELFLNVRNLMNEQPDPWASSGGTSQVGSFGGWLQGDDAMGRYYTLGFRYKL